eukprot:COSAG01_NODE_17715_length_1129_cov_3.184466_1_plen_297_part_10
MGGCAGGEAAERQQTTPSPLTAGAAARNRTAHSALGPRQIAPPFGERRTLGTATRLRWGRAAHYRADRGGGRCANSACWPPRGWLAAAASRLPATCLCTGVVMDSPAPEPEASGAPAAAGIAASRPLWASESWWAGTRREDELGAWLTLLGLSEAEAAAVSERFTQLGMPAITLTELVSNFTTVKGEYVTRFWPERNGIAPDRQGAGIGIVQQGSRGLETTRELNTNESTANRLAEIAKEVDSSNETVLQCRDQLLRRDEIWPGTLVTLFFSGHGAEHDGTHYLLPVGMPAAASLME